MEMPTRTFRRQIQGALCALAVLTAGAFVPDMAAAATYYVGTNGSDNNSCSAARNPSTPKRTISGSGGGVACLIAGDTLYIRAGSYAERIGGSVRPPSGASWLNATTIAAYPGETVVLRPTYTSGQIIGGWSSPPSYVIFDGLILDGINGGGTASDANGIGGLADTHHLRFVNIEIKNMWHQGVLVGGTSYGHEFLNCKIHHNGRDSAYANFSSGMYISADDVLIDGCDIHHNGANGIQIYDGYAGTRIDNVIIRNNRVYSNGQGGQPRSGIVVSTGDGALVYNNLVYDNIGDGIYVHLRNVTNAKIYNNTVHGNSSYGLVVGNQSTGAIIRNNIIYGNSTPIFHEGTSTSFGTNLCDKSSNGCAIVANPAFVDPTAKDFKLKSSSPAVDRGTFLASITSDFAGTARPQGGSFDIGAYEFSTGATPPLPPTNVTIVAQNP